MSRLFCRTVPKPFSSVWEAFGTAFMMRSGCHRPGRIAFQWPSSLRCPLHICPSEKASSTCICTRSSRRLRSRATAIVAAEIVDGLAEVAGALIAGSGSDQRARAAESSDGAPDSWEIACNLLMQHVRFFPQLGKSRRKISNARGTHAPQQTTCAM
jgi:hypothetical protein